jgi:LmbE family N-acetylglucosaminyl deacetylase
MPVDQTSAHCQIAASLLPMRRLTAAFITFVAASASALPVTPTVRFARAASEEASSLRPAPPSRSSTALPGVPPPSRPSSRLGQNRPATDLVVIAPHPDDEVLLASGLLLRAKQAQERVAVIIMTNGDFDCQVDGLVRQSESVQALAELGVAEQDVYFLGYPDGHLARLGQSPLEPVVRRIEGECAHGNHTYGNRGRDHQDYHRSQFGAHATYTVDNALDDLTHLIAQLLPHRLAVTHPNDTHPDHAATYTLARRAVERAHLTPQILRGIVHNGDCWPTAASDTAPCPPGRIDPTEPMPQLTGTLRGYSPDVRVPVPDTCLSPSFEDNPKLRAIAAHHTQTRDDPSSYLFAFARSEEVFFLDGLDQFKAQPLLQTEVHQRDVRNESGAKEPGVFSEAWGPYSLVITPRLHDVAVWRNTDGGPKRLHHWPLPHDTFTRPRTEFELELEYASPNGIAELGVYVSDVLVGVTAVVDSHITPRLPSSHNSTVALSARSQAPHNSRNTSSPEANCSQGVSKLNTTVAAKGISYNHPGCTNTPRSNRASDHSSSLR